MLLYFGTTFLKKKINGQPRSAQAVDWNTVITMVDGTSSKLSNVAREFRDEILSDLQAIKFSKLSGSAIQNEFIRIPGSHMYVYKHKEHKQANTIEFANFERACEKEVLEVHKVVFHCKGGDESHDDLLPFFHSNPELTNIYKTITDSTNDAHRKAKIEKYLSNIEYVELNRECRDDDDRRFHADHNMFCYNEDTWTKRLFVALSSRYHDHQMEYTAHLRGNSCNDAILQKMPKGTSGESLLFHGSPDMMIKHKPIEIHDEEIGISCIETKKNESTVYSSRSMIPQQAGQLICYIHQMIVAQVLNNVMSDKECTTGVGYGLYIMKASGRSILFKVTLSQAPLEVSAKVYYGVAHALPVVCTALDDLICKN